MEGKDRPQQLVQKWYDELGKRVNLMLRICRPIFISGKNVVLCSDFFVVKGIIEIEAKGMYMGSLIMKRRYQPKVFPLERIDTNFWDKEVGNVGMIEEINQYNKSFIIFCMKEPYYVIRIIVSWMSLDEL